MSDLSAILLCVSLVLAGWVGRDIQKLAETGDEEE